MRMDEAAIGSPCDEDLERMRLDPDGLRRHCERCSKAVHDLSAMGPERARALLARTRGSICVSYVADDEGELVFDPPPTPAPARSDFVPLARLAQAASLVASLSACVPQGEEAPLQIDDPPAGLESMQGPAPVVIPSQPPPPPEPTPRSEEPCEPEAKPVRVRKPSPIKGRIRLTGDVIMLDAPADPLL
jgi:hypothetical protein